jgi:hypothetical protein
LVLQNPDSGVIDRFVIVTAEFGNVAGHFGGVTDGGYAVE